MTPEFQAWVRWRLIDKADPTKKPEILQNFNPAQADWRDADWIHGLIGSYGAHPKYQGWRDYRLAGQEKPAQVPSPIPVRWWDAAQADHRFANLYADKADDPLQAELGQKLIEVAELQAKVTALETRLADGAASTQELQRLRASLAATRTLLQNALDQLDQA